MKNKELVYELLKCALWGQGIVPDSADDLHDAYLLCKQQGVLGVGFQGLQRYASLGVLNIDGATENIYLRWMGLAAKLQQNYDAMEAMQGRLHRMFQDADVRCLVLKGLALSPYYEEPKLRCFGDLDIYSPYDFEKIDVLLKSVATTYSNDYYRHTECNVDGITVENHKYLTDVRGQYRWLGLEKYLKDVSTANLANVDVGGLYYPDETFTFVFFVYHALGHFVYEKLSMKFLIDWCMLLKGRDSVPEDVIDARLKAFGLMRFAAYMTKLCELRLGLLEPYLTKGLIAEMDNISEASLLRFEEDMFKAGYKGFTSNSVKDRIDRGLDFYRKRWKVEEFLGVSVSRFVWDKMIAILK